ncbi:testis-specific serine/threonine-protein kinase 1 [Clupea harengus]|uniref:non-specific serine/threonine protein kinase n=1 Tax=Clupea harengus TaxID=7950 RepID=A0A6P3W8Y6_CLUHA|nr:testis-specific serine/threonine-protein kinase 1 [Clupea harengus]
MDESLVLKKCGYILGSTLGDGSYGKVKSAYSESQNANVAVKIINRKKAAADFLEKFLPRELEIQASLSHSNIVKIFKIFETSNGKVFIIMELGVQGDLLEFVKSRGALPEDFSKKLFRQLSMAIKFLHDQDIVHRDLKCENLLLDKDFNLKVSDFGFTRRITYDDTGKMELSKTFCGSAAYAAPEVLQGIPYNSKMYDVWSMGVILFVMMCGSMPYDDSNIKRMLRIQKEHRVDFPRSKQIPGECKDMIYKTLHPDVKKRLDICAILEHHWLGKTGEVSSRHHNGPATSKPASSSKDKKNVEGKVETDITTDPGKEDHAGPSSPRTEVACVT